MRIGIITQPIVNNYGGTLQNYALQHVLRKLGHIPITLDYLPSKSWIRVLMSLLITPFLFFTSKRRTFESCLSLKRGSHVSNFIKDHLNFSCRLDNYNKSLINKYKLDGIIVGSDQVWRPKYNTSVIKDNFLEFTDKLNIKRIAYAASFGTSNWEYPDGLTSICASLAKKFDAISVREKDGVSLCHLYLGVIAQHVIDPTMLLEVEDYDSIIEPSDNKHPKSYILTYILDNTTEKQQIIDKITKNSNLQIVRIGLSRHLQYSISEWISLIKNANLILTDSFHGMIFSIIFNKNFYVFSNDNRGSSRFNSILEEFELTDRYIDVANHFMRDNSNESSIDWTRINNILEIKRIEGIDFINRSLNN